MITKHLSWNGSGIRSLCQAQDILIDGESIRHCINAGVTKNSGYELWIHGDLSQLFSRISDRIAQDDLLRFKDLSSKYLITESWNETVTGDFIPNSVRNFFAQGEGPNWFHKDDFTSLPYVEYAGTEVDTDINIDQDLTYIDTKFVHSLVYTGDVPRGVFLAYGIRSI